MSKFATVSDQIGSIDDNSDQPTRIAIVGGGPRGLFCLQALVDQLYLRQQKSTAEVQIDLFEPSDYPGAGNVYDPRQPDFLRMNFAARYIDAWTREANASLHGDMGTRLNLCQWLQQLGRSEFGEDSFIPRALAGQYLHHCFGQVRQLADSVARLNVHREQVESVAPQRSGWRIMTPSKVLNVQEVALTVGHEGWRSDAAVQENTDWVTAFPVARNLSPSRIPAGSTAVIRGFGLTAIDATLALTEGRGGTFKRRGGRYRYLRSGAEPQRVVPYSRTGRPMLAKPDEARFPQPAELKRIWQRGRDRISCISKPISEVSFQRAVWPAILQSAQEALRCVRENYDRPADTAVLDRWFRLWGSSAMNSSDAQEVLRYSYLVATGQKPPSIAWALGAAWRGLYPALVDAVSHGGLSGEAWPAFRTVAVEMERLAFGPPAENVGRLLALMDEGLVDLSHLDRKDPPVANGLSGQVTYVDAVLPSPHQQTPTGPISRLLSDGWVQRLPGARGIHVDDCGRPVLQTESAPDGLAIFGRATEGCILGNDTLSRVLHKHPVRWARSVARRIGQRETI